MNVPGKRMSWRACACVLLLLGSAGGAVAQPISHRGFVEGMAFAFPQVTVEDRARLVADVLAREEVFARPAPWLRFTAGLDFRANSHDQVDESWQLDFSDRSDRRPRLSVRTLSTTVTIGPVTLDAGKQFIRWGKTDIVVPTDRFAPRDFLTVVDSPFLAVTGVRGTVQAGSFTIDAAWVPRFTPSRVPLLDQRWVVRPVEAEGIPIVEAPSTLPEGSQAGIRIGQMADRVEYSISFYDGFNHLPDIQSSGLDVSAGRIEFLRVHPPIRMYGADSAVPVRWFTIKAEGAYVTSSSPTTDEYVLYVLQIERQHGEWLFVGGYAGEGVTRRRSLLTFAPDRGLSQAAIARASYTIDTNRSVQIETAVRQSGDGVYAKAEYSHARGQHWRATVTAVVVGGERADFFGQYRKNSHLRVAARYSF